MAFGNIISQEYARSVPGIYVLLTAQQRKTGAGDPVKSLGNLVYNF